MGNDQGRKIRDAIVKNSDLFCVEDNQIRRKVEYFAHINIQLCHHKKVDGKWRITIRLLEGKEEKSLKCIYEEEIPIRDIIL